MAAVLLLTLRGTPTLYYGDELGLADVSIPPDRVQDPAELRQPGEGVGRDPVRTPMPWTGAEPQAGFTTGEPWLPLNADWPTRNVEAQAADPHSPLNLHRALLRLRRAHGALSLGDLQLLPADDRVLAYARRHGDDRALAALNLTGAAASVALPPWARALPVRLSTLAGDPAREGDTLHLRPDEAVVLAAAPL